MSSSEPFSTDETGPLVNILEHYLKFHYQNAFESFNTMRKQNILCDVVLVANGVEVPAHRVVLAGCSQYFQTMFASDFADRKQDRIELKKIDSSVLELIVEFIYTSMIIITEKNVQMLLSAADLLLFPTVKDACCKFLNKQLDVTNCLGISALANLYKCLDLAKYADSYVENHFYRVVREQEFLSLLPDQLIKIIRNDNINVCGEEEVFECVMNWVKQDAENRQNYLPAIMEHVRLPLINREYILKYVREEPLVQSNVECVKYVDEAERFHLSNPSEHASIQTQRTKPRQNCEAFLVFTERSGVMYYDKDWKRIFEAGNIPSTNTDAGFAVVGSKAYIIGGSNTANVLVYDILTNQWSTGVPMNFGRSSHGVAVLNDKIYVVGGSHESEAVPLAVSEVFDPKLQEWKVISPMISGRHSFGVGVLNNRLYAVGGSVQYESFTDMAECYDPETDTWQAIASMPFPVQSELVVCMDGILYAIGGASIMCLNKVLVYDPNTNLWRIGAPMNVSRYKPCAVSYNGFLYVVGGYDRQSIEIYYPQEDKWIRSPEEIHTLLYDRPIGVVLVHWPRNLLECH